MLVTFPLITEKIPYLSRLCHSATIIITDCSYVMRTCWSENRSISWNRVWELWRWSITSNEMLKLTKLDSKIKSFKVCVYVYIIRVLTLIIITCLDHARIFMYIQNDILYNILMNMIWLHANILVILRCIC